MISTFVRTRNAPTTQDKVRTPWLSTTFPSFPWPMTSSCSQGSSKYCQNGIFHFMMHKMRASVYFFTEIKTGFLILLLFQFSESWLIFCDFPGPTPGLKNEIIKFHDFPCFVWPVRVSYSLVRVLYQVSALRSKLLSFWIPSSQKRYLFRVPFLEKGTPFTYLHNWPLWVNRQERKKTPQPFLDFLIFFITCYDFFSCRFPVQTVAMLPFT